MKVFVFKRDVPPFNLFTVAPAYKSISRDRSKTDDQILDISIQKWRDKGLIPDGADVHIVDDSVLLNGVALDVFFNDWEWDDSTSKPVVNMSKARVRHMNRIRNARKAEFVKEDREFQIAGDADDNAAKALVSSKRKKLRDIPQTFDLSGASTPEELDALWPAEIERK